MIQERKYDVGIYGLWYGNNYGSMITYYALSKILDGLGKTYAMIKNPLGRNVDVQTLRRSHPLRFGEEHYDITPFYPLSRMREHNKMFDAFLLGSDQMWNYHLSRPYSQSYFFDFVEDDKIRVAYATSFGRDQYLGPAEEKEITRINLARFNAISVRDDFSKRICEQDFGVAAKLVLDPVFLCNRKHYETLIGETDFHIDEDYVFAYILDPTKELGELLGKVIEATGLKVFVVFNESNDREKCIEALSVHQDKIEYLKEPTVQEWLYLYKNSRLVLTDSFHGSCFSIIFEKNFIVLKNNRRGGGRFTHLLGTFGLLDHMAESPSEMLDKFRKFGMDYSIDYEGVYEKASAIKNESMQWLKEALEGKSGDAQSMKKPSRTLQNVITKKLLKHLCMGCGACASACPKDALTLQADALGYYRSVLDYDKCVDCGKCAEVCPAYRLPEKANRRQPACYEFMAADEAVLRVSSSGGAFTVLAREAFRRSGVVAGAAWKDGFKSVEHVLVDRIEELPKLQKSKYLQSYMGKLFRKVRELLEMGRFVLFSGTPCQVTGLKKYLGREYENLLLVDIFCSNAPSAMFFRKYMEQEFPNGVRQYNFRTKRHGHNCTVVEIEKVDGAVEVRNGGKNDNFQRVYHNHTMCPMHCEQCQYQEIPRFGDITIGDFWGISKYDDVPNKEKGVSVLLCNNEKGAEFLKNLPGAEIGLCKKVPLEWIGGNGFAVNNHNWKGAKRNLFYDVIQRMNFREAVNYALKPNHGIYPRIPANAPLAYNAHMTHFSFDRNYWEETFINGAITLITKVEKPPIGIYATLPLNLPLEKGKKYVFHCKFLVRTNAGELFFHIKDSGSRNVQVIHRHKTAESQMGWQEVRTEFVPDSDIYDEFMVGASQIRGEGNCLAIEYVYFLDSQK